MEYIVEILLWVEAPDQTKAEICGKSIASFARREARGVTAAVVSGVRKPDEPTGDRDE